MAVDAVSLLTNAGAPGAGSGNDNPSWWADSQPNRFAGGAANDASAPVDVSARNETVAGETFFTKFGAVEVTPRNFYRLMQRNEAVLLYPGGVREHELRRTFSRRERHTTTS